MAKLAAEQLEPLALAMRTSAWLVIGPLTVQD